MKRSTLILSAGLVLGAVTSFATPATAEGVVPPELRPRVELMCSRVPTLQQSVQARIDRIQAGADTRGSVAWLQEMRTRAVARDRTDLVNLIDTRIQVRTNLVPVLERRQAQLVTIAAKCQELRANA
jgi:hypothetical protein